MSSLRKGRLDSRSRTKGTAGSKARQDKSLTASFSKVIPSLRMWSMAGSKGSKLISAIFQLLSLVVATAIRDGNCFAIMAIN
jgi:hypothetical protein